jgi:cell division protein FtsW (lipid II flippase)
MHLVFDIFQGIGVAAAVGIRPFLPGLVAGALAAGDVELSFDHTHFHFLAQPLFLLIMVVAIVILGVVERRLAGRGQSRVLTAVLTVCALAIGALFCGGAVARSHHSEWIGVGAGIVCAAVGIAATQPLLARVRGRLDAEAGPILPLLTDAAAALAAALSIVAPPLGVILVAALVWLLIVGRGATEQKYAGLRILR